MLRDIKYLFKIAAWYIYGLPVAVVAFVAAYFFLFGGDAHNGFYISGMIVTLILSISFTIGLSFYTSFANISLSMGSTRKSVFLSIQIYKIVISFAMFATLFLVNEELKFFYNINVFTNFNWLILCFGAALILCTLGESLGIVMSRWSRVGVAIFTILCLLFGACVGLAVAIGDKISFNVISFALQGPWQSLAALVVASAIISAGNSIMYRKSVVS